MSKLLNYIAFVIFLLSVVQKTHALTRFEDIDKNPIGTYQGQFLFGAYQAFGFPFGEVIAAEEDFLDGTTYTFEEQEITKTIVISHLNISFAAFCEYVFLDHFGARLTFSYSSVIQRTHFGIDYNNESLDLYKDYSIFLSPTYHLNVRKRWDVAFIPKFGAAFISFSPTPIADKLVEDFSQEQTFDQTSFIFGLRVEGLYFFENGVFIQSGLEWNYTSLTADPISRTDSSAIEYNNGSSETSINFFRFSVGAGYALFH